MLIGIKDYNRVFNKVDNFECSSCLQQSSMFLMEVNGFVTLFLIPLIPIGSDFYLICETCHKKISLTKSEFTTYKQKSDLVSLIKAEKSKNIELDYQLIEVNQVIEEQKKIKTENAIIQSEQWINLVANKSDNELLTIHYQERAKYTEAMQVAVINELKRRRLI